jgi:hypothetical protein
MCIFILVKENNFVNIVILKEVKSKKAVPLHAMEALGGEEV